MLVFFSSTSLDATNGVRGLGNIIFIHINSTWNMKDFMHVVKVMGTCVISHNIPAMKSQNR